MMPKLRALIDHEKRYSVAIIISRGHDQKRRSLRRSRGLSLNAFERRAHPGS